MVNVHDTRPRCKRRCAWLTAPPCWFVKCLGDLPQDLPEAIENFVDLRLADDQRRR